MFISRWCPQVVPRLTFLSFAALGVALAAACGDGTSEPSNQAPQAVGSMPDLEISVGQTDSQDVTEYFSDPDGDTLSYEVESSATSVATASVTGSGISVTGATEGTVTVTANDQDGLSATQSFEVTVMSGFRDDFDSSASLSDWEASDEVEAEVVDGILRLTLTSDDGFGHVTHDLGGRIESDWEASARMGSADTEAWPSLWIWTGDSRYTLYSLDIGVFPSEEETANYLLWLYDDLQGGWLLGEAGASSAINTGAGEFTEVTLTFENGTYRASAGSTQLFEGDLFDWMPTDVDSIALGIDWGGLGTTVLFDWVAIEGLEGAPASARHGNAAYPLSVLRKRFGTPGASPPGRQKRR